MEISSGLVLVEHRGIKVVVVAEERFVGGLDVPAPQPETPIALGSGSPVPGRIVGGYDELLFGDRGGCRQQKEQEK
jgi:hypothetical protein